MPKLKCVSSSHSASQAKKRKKNQREDPVKRQQERQCDSLRHQLNLNRQDRSDSEERGERRRERNTEAHRTACLDTERIQQEQGRNTAAHRQVRLRNPERRREE